MNNSVIKVQTPLYSKCIEVPKVIQKASGIYILSRYIKSIVFTTDVVVIKNNNADAIMAVYPFTPQPILSHALATVANMPLMVGVGGGTTTGDRVVEVALDAEFQGVLSVILNAPIDNETLMAVRKAIEIPIIVSVVSTDWIEDRLKYGADILNVCAGKDTIKVIKYIRDRYPDVPIIATGGPTDEIIEETIDAGANAIVYTPPTTTQLMKDLMETYRT
ncbi:hydrolase [Halonatronum saccharophilum]|uniref:hydrolase n=1 Tax=Halonatronum saccharophilum TaxID=150060 RepID=UPI000485ED6E|nr:hydrolase [Halonatronum saccharophilum]